MWWEEMGGWVLLVLVAESFRIWRMYYLSSVEFGIYRVCREDGTTSDNQKICAVADRERSSCNSSVENIAEKRTNREKSFK